MDKISISQARLINAQVLAFVGDGVHTLRVRTALSVSGSKSGQLHGITSKLVCAQQQCKYAEILFPILTIEEQEIFMRARNTKLNSVPKNATVEDYHKATAFEAVIGYLYLIGNNDRIEELFAVIET